MGNASCCVREQDSCPITKRVDRSGGKEHDNVQELAVDTNEIPSQSNRKSRKETETIYEEDLAGDTSEVYVGETFPRDEISTNFLAHISEREAADDIEEDDPSTHPSVQPTFMERSKSEMKLKENRRSLYMLDQLAASGGRLGSQPAALRKSSSCSTIYLDDSTISQPHLKNTIKCIALAIFYHISNRRNRGHERLMEIFEERLHPISRDPMPAEMMTRDPDERMIYRFVRNLFSSAMLTAECAIITLIYLERLLNYAEMDLCPSNWRRVVLASIMLASKVWDDQAVWNVDYCQILGDMNVDDMNELERRFLECLDFNINVPSSVYAKYYFDLRTLAIANDLHLPLQPLYRERAKKLEAMSQTYEDKMDALKWSFSTENLVKKAPAVLS